MHNPNPYAFQCQKQNNLSGLFVTCGTLLTGSVCCMMSTDRKTDRPEINKYNCYGLHTFGMRLTKQRISSQYPFGFKFKCVHFFCASTKSNPMNISFEHWKRVVFGNSHHMMHYDGAWVKANENRLAQWKWRALCCKSNCNLAEWTSDHLTYHCGNNKLKYRTMGRDNSIKVDFSEHKHKKIDATRTQTLQPLSSQYTSKLVGNISSWCANFWLMSTNLSTCPSILWKQNHTPYCFAAQHQNCVYRQPQPKKKLHSKVEKERGRERNSC